MRAGLRGSLSKTSFRYFVSTSTSSRAFANTIVFKPSFTAARAIRVLCERADARRPRSGFTTGGFQISRRFAPCGAPDSVTAVTGSPSRRSASSRGFAIVAEQRMNVGFAPWNRATRFSRRITLAMCAPNTPRYVCSSSITT